MSDRRTRTPWVLWGVAMLLLAGTITFSVANGSFGTDTWFIPLAIAMILGYTTVGALLASRNPRNPIGWVMIAVGLAFVTGGFSDEFVTYTYVTNPGSLPGGPFAAWALNWIYGAMMAPLPLLGLLFPTGRVPGPRWRFLVPGTLICGAVVIAGSMLTYGFVTDAPVPILNPTGIRGFPEAVPGIAWVGILAGLVASVAAVVVRYRRSAGEERQQLRWLAYVAIAAVAVVVLAVAMTAIFGESFGSSVAGQILGFGGFAVVGIGVPAAMGVAVLKYRLYDLDVVIKKTIVFGILALLIAAISVGSLLAVTTFISFAAPDEAETAAIAATMFVVGSLVWPLWRLSRRIADRVVYGGRAKPYEVLTEFSDRVASAYSTEDVLPRMAHILAQGTGALSARVWLRVGSSLHPAASWPEGQEGAPLPVANDGLPSLPRGESAVEVRHRGEPLGALSVRMPPNDPMNPGKERLIRDLASQAGLVLRNVRLIEQLRASRRRLVAAQDEERRRLERNIHDGAQQQLVALSVKLRLADQLVDRDADRAHELLTQLQAETNTALEDLRDLARGIYPPLLADKGLPAAIDAQVRKASLPVTVEPNGVGRYSPEVEAAVYFSCLEALQNVAKYAGATKVSVLLSQGQGELRFEVTDDGAGFDPSNVKRGLGLQGMSDRIEAIGGTLEIRSALGAGTTVAGRVPV